MKHYGDITKINGGKVEPVWVLCGGSPCQDLSVAGLRKGLQHSALGDGETTRSGLFMEQIRIAKEMRENDKANGRTGKFVRCRWMVWENVQGAFSSGTPKGEDFRIVLEEIAKIADESAVIPGPPNGKWTPSGCILGNGWSIAWLLHDAQYHGTPQRRRRIYVCADFNGESAPRILFELRRKTADTEFDQTFTDPGMGIEHGEVQTFTEGLSRDLEPSGAQGQGVAEDSEGCANPSSFTLKIRGGREVDSHGRKAGKGALIQEELSGTLGVSQDQTLISVYGICSDASNSMKSDNPHSGIYEADTSRTLDLNGGNPNCNQGGMVVVEGNGSRESHKGDGYRESETMYTLNATEHHAIAYRKEGHPQNAQQGQGWEEAEINDTLNNNNDNTDGHTPTVIVEIRHKHHRRKKNG